MAARLVLDPKKDPGQMTPAELRILALRGGSDMNETDPVQVAAEQDEPGQRLRAAGQDFSILGGFGGGSLNMNPAAIAQEGQTMQAEAQAGRTGLVEALKSRQAARLQQESLQRQEEQLKLQGETLRNTVQNTGFQQGIETTRTNQALVEGNRVPQAERSELAGYDSAIQAAQNAMAQYDKSPTQFVGSTGAAFVPLVAAGLGPGGQATEEAMRAAERAFPGVKDVAAGALGIKTGRKKFENLITDLQNKRANKVKTLQEQGFGGTGGASDSPASGHETKTVGGKRYGKINGKWHEL